MHWTRQWWQEYAGESRLLTSAAVIDELREGTGAKNEQRIALLQSASNANKFHHIRVVNFEIGLPCPVLTPPLNFLSAGEDYE